MSRIGEMVIDSARGRVGQPFLHHFKPENNCEGGTITVDGCMEKGLDGDGYDCSGLVIASICDVLGMDAERWPQDWRHLNQLKSLAEPRPANPGDVMFFDPQRSNRVYHGAHMGIFVAKHCVVHASGISGFVEEGPVDGDFQSIKVVPLSSLIRLSTE